MYKKNLAQIISRVLDPPILAITILLVAIGRSPMSFDEMIVWLVAVIVLNAFVPFLFFVHLTNKGYVFDDDLENKDVNRQRIKVLIVFLIVVGLEVLVMVSTHQYQPLLAVFTGGLISISLGMMITYYWKISMHSALITFFVAMLLFLYGLKIWPAVLLIPLIFWSRLYLNRHTISQLLAGMILASLVLIGTFLIFGLI